MTRTHLLKKCHVAMLMCQLVSTLTSASVTGKCESDRFYCHNNGDDYECIPKLWACNGVKDCKSSEDEAAELCERYHASTECTEEEMECPSDHRCFPVAFKCDAEKDCIDGADEANCTDLSLLAGCHPNQVKCVDDGRCISSKFVCDGVSDCHDGSDEALCKDACAEALHHFHCNSGVSCIPIEKVCDKNSDCPDRSDEAGRCADKSCDLPCANGKCYKTPGGPRCLCNPGYEERDGKCKDIDECNRFSVCDHDCSNTEGNFTCACKEGYTLIGKEICKASGNVSAFLLYTSNTDVRVMYIDSREQRDVYSGSKHVTAITYDPISEQVYWSDNSRMVLRKSLTGSNTPYIIIHSGIGVIYDLVMDWVGRNIYIADRDNKRIVVCNVNTISCRSLMTKPVNPTAVKLDIATRRIYWSDTVEHRIMTASMDGTDTRVLASENLTWPNAMDIDSPARRLYWMDAQKKNLETYALDQAVRQEVPQFELNHPFSMAVWEDKIYWNDWKENAIYSAHKKDGRNKTLIIRDHNGAGISISHPQKIKDAISGENPCESSGCSHLCLLRPTSLPFYTCACPAELQLAGNGKHCIDKEETTWLAVGIKDSLYKVQYRDFVDPLVSKVPHSDLIFKKISDVDYDPVDGSVFISDMGLKKIVKINLELRKVTTILTDLQRPTGIAVDWTRGNLYWVNNFIGGLEVSTTAGYHRSKLILGTRCLGMDVAVSPSTGRVVIACEGPGRILSCYRNGGPCAVLSATPLRTPLGLAIDQRGMGEFVYWTDNSGNRVYRTALDGSGSQSLSVLSPAAVHFASGKLYLSSVGLFNSLFYKTNFNESDWNALNLHDPSIDSGSRQSRGHTTLAEVGWPVSDARQRVSIQKFCIEGKELCGQLCLEDEHSKRVCACANKYILDENKLRCIPEQCPPHQYTCLTDGRCIPKNFTCNGIDDCTDASDESSILCKPCSQSTFQCQSKDCIDKVMVCNGHKDCLDNSDERDCPPKTCQEGYSSCTDGHQCYLNVNSCDGVADCEDASDEKECPACPPDQFLCTQDTRQCHPNAWRCDGIHDCLDGSDEANCNNVSCSPQSFLCSSDNLCIDGSKVCDSIMHCSGGEDELAESCMPTAEDCSSPASNCTLTCKNGDYPCKSGRQCIDESLVCDGVSQCTDASDEESCSAIYVPGSASYSHCPRDSFACADGISCIRGDAVCDGEQDCIGGDDEDAQCEDACKEGGGCEHICQKGPLGARCSCRGGFKLASNGRSCLDVDECSISDPCEQKCVNIEGGFRCRCSTGYALARDQESCRPTNGSHSRLAYVSGGSLRWLGGTGPQNLSLGGHSITQLHYDAVADQLMAFNTIGTLCTISSVPSSRSSVMTGFSPASLFALDAPARTVYVASSVRGRLQSVATLRVCSLGSGVCYCVYEEPDVDIAAVTLASTHRLLFFCINGQDGAAVSRIMQTQPDGSGRLTIVEKHLKSCSHLALDEHKQRIYWVDPELGQINSASWSGDAMTLYTALTAPALSLYVSGSWIQWLLPNGTLQRCKKLASRPCHSVALGVEDVPSAVTVTQAAPLQISQTCLSNPCQHLCLPNKAGRQCLCEGENDQRCSTVNIVKSGCDPDPCTPGGTCQPGVCGGYTCRCLPGYEGSTCYVSKEGLQPRSNFVTPLVVVILLLAAAAAGAYYYFYYKKPLFLFMRKTSRSTSEVQFSNRAFGASKDEIDATLRVKRNLDMSNQQGAGRLVTVHVDTDLNLADHVSEDRGSACRPTPASEVHYSLM